MLNKIAFSILSISSLLSFNAYAEEFDVTIVGVDANQGTFFIGVDHDTSNNNCSNKSELKWNLDDEGTKEILALAITAKSLGKKVHVGVSSSTCVEGQPTGNYLYMEN